MLDSATYLASLHSTTSQGTGFTQQLQFDQLKMAQSLAGKRRRKLTQQIKFEVKASSLTHGQGKLYLS